MVSLKRPVAVDVDPGVCFVILVLSNALLAYVPITFMAKGWIFFIGILIPLLLLVSRSGEPYPKSLELREAFDMPQWGWVLLGCFALGLRFFKLTNFHLWPTGDEGLHGYLAIPLSQKWDWRFFYTVGEHPPLLIWCLSFFFKWFDSPFFNLWFLPALFSALTVPIGYLAARHFFSRGLSFLFVFLLAFSYWPLYFGRFCHQGIFVPFFELFGFWLLGRYFKAPRGGGKGRMIFWVGLWTGLGSFTFTSWAVVILLMALTVFAVHFKNARLETRPLGWFSLGLLSGLAPFLAAAIREGYGHHLIDSSSASRWFSQSHEFLTRVSYLTNFLWGNLQPGASYAPTWGGILNPLLAACFLWGLTDLFRHRNVKIYQWLAAGFFICLLPGLLSADYVEFNRVIQVPAFPTVDHLHRPGGVVETVSRRHENGFRPGGPGLGRPGWVSSFKA